jgi:hypothetical protein
MSRKKVLEKLINQIEFPFQPRNFRFPLFLFPVDLPGIVSYYLNMIKNTLSQWKDRSHSDITDEEINSLSGDQYQAYLAWRIQVNLDFMEAEGFIVKELNEEGIPVYRAKTDEELQAEVDNL